MFYIKRFIQNNKKLSLILLLALALRLIGIFHGYPFIFNIDEPTVVRSTLSLRFTPFIDHFDWPHFNYYLNYFFYFIFIKLRSLIQILNLRSMVEGFFPVIWSDPFIFYLISRILSAVFGALTVLPVYFLTLEISKNKKSALFAAIFMSVIPFHAYFSHFALQDGVMLFWLSCAIYFSYIGVLQNNLKSYLLSGLFFGLAVGTKYNAILFMAMVPAFSIEKYLSNRKDFLLMLKNGIYLSLVSGIIFVLTSYSLLFKWAIFWSEEYGKGILWQLKYNVVALPLVKYPQALIENIKELSQDFSLFGLAIIVSGVILILRSKKTIGVVSMILASALYFLYVSRFARSPSHYFLPMYAFLPIFAGFSISYLNKNIKILMCLFVTLMFFTTFCVSYKFTFLNSKTEAINKYAEIYEKKIYYKGEGLDSANGINNIGMKKYNDDIVLTSDNILISEIEIKSDKIKQVEYIGSKNRYGNPIYVYTGN